jgi:2-polyprenyl-3-methyl-5-hydroxy-6-metoxy-1,4-benzoquinol methylase
MESRGSLSDRERWDRRYVEDPGLATLAPVPFLVSCSEWFPREGRALDVACGAGRNAVFLAEAGLLVHLQTDAVAEAVEEAVLEAADHLQRKARARGSRVPGSG